MPYGNVIVIEGSKPVGYARSVQFSFPPYRERSSGAGSSAAAAAAGWPLPLLPRRKSRPRRRLLQPGWRREPWCRHRRRHRSPRGSQLSRQRGSPRLPARPGARRAAPVLAPIAFFQVVPPQDFLVDTYAEPPPCARTHALYADSGTLRAVSVRASVRGWSGRVVEPRRDGRIHALSGAPVRGISVDDLPQRLPLGSRRNSAGCPGSEATCSVCVGKANSTFKSSASRMMSRFSTCRVRSSSFQLAAS